MGTITYQLPIVGQPDSTEEAKIPTALQALLTLVNGNIDTNNLSPTAGITAAQHAAGVVRWNYVTDALTTHTLADGQMYSSTFNGAVTVTLPAATAGTLCAVLPSGFASGAQPTTVQRAGADLIYGLGVNAATSILLGTPSEPVVLFCTTAGSWLIVSGQQDTGWVAVTLNANFATVAGAYPVATRLLGDRVYLRGSATNTSPNPQTFTATLGTPFRPASLVNFVISNNNSGTQIGIGCSVSTAGVVTVANSTTNTPAFIAFDGVSYSVA